MIQKLLWHSTGQKSLQYLVHILGGMMTFKFILKFTDLYILQKHFLPNLITKIIRDFSFRRIVSLSVSPQDFTNSEFQIFQIFKVKTARSKNSWNLWVWDMDFLKNSQLLWKIVLNLLILLNYCAGRSLVKVWQKYALFLTKESLHKLTR